MDTWQDMGHSLNLRIKLEPNGQKGEKNPIFLVLSEREKEERRRVQASLHDLQSSISWNSSSQERNFIALTRATRGYRKRGGTKNAGFYRESKRGVQEITNFGFGKCPRGFLGFILRSKRWRILPAWVYFLFLGKKIGDCSSSNSVPFA